MGPGRGVIPIRYGVNKFSYSVAIAVKTVCPFQKRPAL